MDPCMLLTPATWMIVIDCKVLHFINDEDYEVLGYKTLRRMSMRYLTITLPYPKIPTYSWTFTPIPNWTWSCSSILSFVTQIFNLWLTSLHESQYVTNFFAQILARTNFNNLNDCYWLQNSSFHKWWRS